MANLATKIIEKQKKALRSWWRVANVPKGVRKDEIDRWIAANHSGITLISAALLTSLPTRENIIKNSSPSGFIFNALASRIPNLTESYAKNPRLSIKRKNKLLQRWSRWQRSSVLRAISKDGPSRALQQSYASAYRAAIHWGARPSSHLKKKLQRRALAGLRRRHSSFPSTEALYMYLADPTLTSAELDPLVHEMDSDVAFLSDVVSKHPGIEPAQLLAICQYVDDGTEETSVYLESTVRAAAGNESCLQDKRYRELALRHFLPDQIPSLLKFAESKEEFSQIWDEKIPNSSRPFQSKHLLDEKVPLNYIKTIIGEKNVQSWLTHSDRSVRQNAILLLSRFRRETESRQKESLEVTSLQSIQAGKVTRVEVANNSKAPRKR